MMLEIARFWASIAHFNPERDRYEIHGVMGPDEFHEKLPRRRGGRAAQQRVHQCDGGLALRRSPARCSTLLPHSRRDALRSRLEISTTRSSRMGADMSRRMFVPFHDDGIISQFEGYEQLEELDWDAYRERYGNIQRLDRILSAEGDDPNRYKVAKQADMVMLFYLFSARRARRLFGGSATCTRAGTAAPERRVLRPAHLARLHSQLRHPRGVARRARPRQLLAAFPRRAESDVERRAGRHDPGGHPPRGHGRHAGSDSARLPWHRDPRRRPVVLAATARPARRPVIPDGVPGHADHVSLDHHRLELVVHREGADRPIKVGVGDDVRELCPGRHRDFTLSAAVAARRHESRV